MTRKRIIDARLAGRPLRNLYRLLITCLETLCNNPPTNHDRAFARIPPTPPHRASVPGHSCDMHVRPAGNCRNIFTPRLPEKA